MYIYSICFSNINKVFIGEFYTFTWRYFEKKSLFIESFEWSMFHELTLDIVNIDLRIIFRKIRYVVHILLLSLVNWTSLSPTMAIPPFSHVQVFNVNSKINDGLLYFLLSYNLTFFNVLILCNNIDKQTKLKTYFLRHYIGG